jgi:hypothetical protein
MRKLFTLFMFIWALGIAAMGAQTKAYELVTSDDEPEIVVIAQWNGYTQGSPPADGKFPATEGVLVNKNVAILTRDASGTNFAVNKDLIAASQGWDGAGVTEKYWIVTLSTKGCEDLLLTSKQKGSGTGPRDFKIQYSIDATSTWIDLTDGVVTVANDNYKAGVKEDLPLPAELNDKESVSLRWLATSTASIDDGTVAAAGANRLEVIIKGLSNGGGEPVLSSDATLKSLTVGGLNILKPNTYDYAYKLKEGTTEVPAIAAETNHEKATINEADKVLPTISGIIDGTNNRAVFPVVAEDGVATQTYTITFSIKETVEGRVFFETCGEDAPTTGTRPAPALYTGWDNSAPVTFDGSADVRATSAINSHVWFAANSEKNLIISGINTANASNLKLSFDIACNKAGANANAMFIKVKDLVTNEETSITVPSTEIPEQNKYVQVTNLEGIPVTENLEITFYATAESNPSGYGYRLDNIQITEGTVVELSSNNNLKSLSVSKGTLKPAFDPAVLVYSVVLPENDAEAPSITCEAEDSKATVALDEPESVPGTATITVTAENGDVKTYKVTYSNAVPAGVWMETFETETTKDSYVAGDYQGTAALWDVSGVVRNDDDNDKKHGLASLRLRDPNTANPETHHYIAMKEDKANGAGRISLYHGMYSAHTGGAYTLEVSNDGGKTWNAFSSEVEEVPAGLTQIAFNANVGGNIRIKITKQSGGTSSINIDDIMITDYEPDGVRTVNSSVYLYTQYNNLFVKNADANAKITIFDVAGKRIESAGATEFTLPAKGVYIVKVNSEVFKVINK